MTKFFILVFSLMIIAVSSMAAEINCYSGKERFYHGKGEDVMFGRDFMSFTEKKSKDLILVHGECVVKTHLAKGDKISATTTW